MKQLLTFRDWLFCLLLVPTHLLLCKRELFTTTCGRVVPLLSGNITRLAPLAGRSGGHMTEFWPKG